MTITYASGQTANEQAYTRNERLDLFGEHSVGVTIRCAWGDRFNVAAAALASQDPYLGPLGVTSVLCLEATITPVKNSSYTQDGQGCVYEEADITLKYSVPPGGGGAPVTKTDPVSSQSVLVTESLEPTIEYLKLDPKGFRWTNSTGDPIKDNEAPSRVMNGMNLVRSVQDLPALDTSLLSLPGKVNLDAYTSTLLGLTFPTETLLFVPPSIRRVVKMDGSDTISLVLKLSYKEKGWNKFWRPNKSGTDKYDSIYDVISGAVYQNFPTASMANWLF